MTSRKLYDFNDHPEHRDHLKPWADKWIANAMSTAPMTEADREACRQAVFGMYAAAKLPPPKHIVFVPSPFVLVFAGGFASAIWRASRNGWPTEQATWQATWLETRQATRQATELATRLETRQATWLETRQATEQATELATRQATEQATELATRQATWQATEQATWQATWLETRQATRQATELATRLETRQATWLETRQATEQDDLSNWYVVGAGMRDLAAALGVGDFGLRCAAQAWRMWSGGNQYSGHDAYLSFFQEVAGLSLDYSAYNHWRTLAERSGPRIMHADFCMISDRPSRLMVDEQSRPHCENGPFCEWRDGSKLYSWHGARVPAAWIEHKDTISPSDIIRHENVELRAAGAAIVGWPKMLSVLKSKVIDDSGSPDIGQLIELELPGLDEPGRFLKAACPRNGIIVEGVPRVSDIDNLPIETALAAQAWRIGDPLSDYIHPETRT